MHRPTVLCALLHLLLLLLLLLAAGSEGFLNAKHSRKRQKLSSTRGLGSSGHARLAAMAEMNDSAEVPHHATDDSSSASELFADDDDADEDPNSQLSQYIRSRTRPSRRPVLHAHDLIEVHVRASLYQIVDLDQRNNLATLSAYFDVWWHDAFVPWNATDFEGITHTFVPLRWVWRPEFYLYHSIQGRTPEFDPGAMVEVSHNGMVRLFVPITSRALCPINVKYFPFDAQNCTFLIGSWSYQSKFVQLLVEDRDVFLGDFYDNQEWLLIDAVVSNGSMHYLGNESFSMVQMTLLLRRQSFYYVFNLVFPTTLVSLVAVIGFHAPINATGRRESKFRLGVMTLLSLSVMLLMLVDEMKFALESIPGQRGSFSDVPLIGIYYMSLILTISVATCTSSIFVHLEKFALRNPSFSAIPYWLRPLAAKSLVCGCYAPRRLRMNKGEHVKRNRSELHVVRSNHSSADSLGPAGGMAPLHTLIPTQLNFTEYKREARAQKIQHRSPTGIGDVFLAEETTTFSMPPSRSATAQTRIASPTAAERAQLEESGHSGSHAPSATTQKLDLMIALMREVLEIRRDLLSRNQLPVHWERVLKRLENCSLTFYLGIIALNIIMLLWPELWY